MPLNQDLFGETVEHKHGSKLAEAFDYPPFSVLNAREGWWQERKRQWIALGIQSEIGRGGQVQAQAAGQWNSPEDSGLNMASELRRGAAR